MKNASITTKKSWLDVENIIDREIAEIRELTDLTEEDIAEIRLDTYLKCGWSEDPFPDSLHAEPEDEGYTEPSWHDLTMSQRLSQVGMSWADFL